MKSLFKWLILAALLVALLALAAAPALAQGPTTTPAPTGKTVADALPLSCDWTYMPPAPAQGYYSDLFYKVPYQKNTQLVIYMSAVPQQDPNSFRFEVYRPYDASLRYLFDEPTVVSWDNWKGQPAGSSMPDKFELGDLSWSGKLDLGALDGYFIVDVMNFKTTDLWFNLCSRSYYNFK